MIPPILSLSLTVRHKGVITINTENELTPIFDPRKASSTIEAVLFAAGYPVTREKLMESLTISETELEEALGILKEKYSDPDGGILLVFLSDCIQLCTNEKYKEEVKEALGIKKGGNLSRSSLEVLAIIAYNQPVTKSYIESVRGVDCTYTVTSLLEKDLIENCGTLDAPGRPSLYRTTPDFLRIFGISDISELPPYQLVGADGQVVIKP